MYCVCVVDRIVFGVPRDLSVRDSFNTKKRKKRGARKCLRLSYYSSLFRKKNLFSLSIEGEYGREKLNTSSRTGCRCCVRATRVGFDASRFCELLCRACTPGVSKCRPPRVIALHFEPTLRPAREAVPVSRAALFQCKKPVRPVTFPKDVYTSFGITRDSLFFFLNVRQAGRCRDGKKDLFSSRKNFHSDLSLDETTR